MIKKPIYEERVRDNKILNEVEWEKKTRAITERIDRPRIRRVASYEHVPDCDYEDDSHSSGSQHSSTAHKLARIEEKLQNSQILKSQMLSKAKSEARLRNEQHSNRTEWVRQQAEQEERRRL